MVELNEILKHFPKDEAYPYQEEALLRIVRAFDIGGAKTILLEAPVGFGKSAVAICLARYYKTAHILTPRKSLQDQYFEDFSQDVVTLKGMSSYPCYPAADNRKSREFKPVSSPTYEQTIKLVESGRSPVFKGPSCASGPCRTSRDTFKECVDVRPCPYQAAIYKAMSSPVTVSNLHSFIANSLLLDRLKEKQLLIVDEAHDMRGILQDYLVVNFTVPYSIVSKRIDIPDYQDLKDWEDWFRQPIFVKDLDKEAMEIYLDSLKAFNKYDMKNFVISYEESPHTGDTKFTFQPRNLGNAAENFILKYGVRRILMSGTIYDKKHFCMVNGLDEEDTIFIRMPSTFPPTKCPIILKKQAMSDNSYKGLEQNFERNVSAIKRAMAVYHNVRGLIHAPSYDVARRLQIAIGSDRVISHTPESFQETLRYFQEESPDNTVLISPTCVQGIDLKYDRARFQMIVRVPYPNASDAFMKDLFETSPQAYFYEALVSFGQMLGRVMRAPDDWGHTILLDERFDGFIKKHYKWLGEDVMKRVQKT